MTIYKTLIFTALILLSSSNSMASPAPVNQKPRKTVLEQKNHTHNKTAQYPGVVNLYRPNYFLPYYYTGTPYYAIYNNETPYNQSVMNEELKAQLSFLVPLVRHLIQNKPLSLNFAYTQLMYWQVYAKSQYFRETNYEPEFFFENHFNRYVAAQTGVDHQSNGRGGAMERSWNRAFLQLQFSGTHWLAHVKGWGLIDQGNSSDMHNPDIAYFLGYSNILLTYDAAPLDVSLEMQNLESGLKRGFVQLTLSWPLFNSVSLYAQYFNGYGQSLIEYDHKTASAGIGIALNDWMT